MSIVKALVEIGLEPSTDAYGNIVAHYRHSPPSSQPPVAFVAHMDHPGFEVVEASRGRVVARALGGVPVASMSKPTAVLVLTSDGQRLPAKTAPHEGESTSTLGGTPDRLVELILESDADISPPAPVVFDLPDFRLDGDIIRMRALDDLAGCAGTLSALERLVSEKADADVYGVFTRAEEVGLFGARLTAEAGTLPRDTLVVSVEASKVIPGVAQGEGPVIRTGDAAYTFDAEAEQVLIAARESLLKRDRGFKSQRQLMSGGTCEATAFAVFGYRVTGVAFPLGNYHNATTEIQDPDGGVEAEYIHLSDFLGGVALLEEAARIVATRGSTRARGYLSRGPRRCQETAGGWGEGLRLVNCGCRRQGLPSHRRAGCPTHHN